MKKTESTVWFWRRLVKNRPAFAGFVVITLIIITAVIAPLIVDYRNSVIKQQVGERLQGISVKHWFGTDGYGRDIFARVIYGARSSLLIAFATAIGACTIGTALGITAAYYRRLNDVIMRIVDTVMCLPPLLFSLTIVAALGAGTRNLIVAVMITFIPYFTRVARASALSIIHEEYIEAARCLGAGDLRIIVRHILLNAMGPIAVQATMSVSYIIMLAAGLSFIGLGVQPPTPEWGAMLADGREHMRYSVFVVAFPGLAIVLTSLSLNLFGDGLRDILDPRTGR
ncbi:MAG: ABC transporter permease [Treponema sp.]|jgi:peptide/nickel transport system permease protein|nr:ABC transporter permease [Treponema sp.]